MKTKAKLSSKYRRAAPIILIALLAIYFLLPKIGSFNTSLQTVFNADIRLIVLAVVFFIGTYFAAAASYYFITYFKLRYWPTVLIQIADGFTNRIAPAGIGAVATNVLYLMKQSKSGAQAGFIAGLNNLIGYVAHILLLVILLFASQQSPRSLLHFNVPHFTLLLTTVLIFLGIVVVLFWRRLKKLSTKGLNYIAKGVAASLAQPYRLLMGLLAAMLITILYCLTLYAVMQALSVHISFMQAFLVLTVSVIAMTVTPTPGGLGGVEAGLVATMVSFGVAAGPALSVALVYRFITYWLPIVPGAVALEIASQRGYIGKIKH